MARLSSSEVMLVCCMALCIIFGTKGLSGGGSSGSASGSGSGDMDEGEGVVVESEVAECVDDLPREEDEGGDLTSSTAYTAAMCSLLCMENVTSNPLHEDIELENSTVGGVWWFKSFPKFSSENVNTNCNAYREFAECIRGCLVRVEPAAAQFTGKQCKSECVDQCNDEKQIDSLYFNPYCSIDCEGLVCRQGCDNYQWIVRSSNTPGSPPSPRQGPEVVSSSKNGDINVSISQSAPSTNDPGQTPSSVGIIYRVVDKATNVTRYYYKVSPDEPLSLFEFACREVSLSFAVVNKFGLSQETSPLSFTVPGGEIHVRPPVDVQVREEVDRRPGFFGHAVLTISWSHPQGYVEYLHQYVVKVQRYNSNQSYTSPHLTTTSLTVSDGERSSVFLLGGDVRIKVCTQRGESEECEVKNQRIQNVYGIWGNAVNITDCIPRWNGSHFNIILHWTVPEFVAYGEGIFSSFLIAAEERLTKRFIDIIIVYKKPNQTSYSYMWLGLPPLDSQRRYEFRVSIQWLDSNDYRKPDTVDAKCPISAVAPPPSPVLDVTLSDLEFSNGEIDFLVQWSPPATPNGRITHYLACLGGRRLSNFEDNTDTTADKNSTTCQLIDSEVREYFWKQKIPQPHCLFYQMRAHTELGGGGEWSEAVAISARLEANEGSCANVTQRNGAAIEKLSVSVMFVLCLFPSLMTL